MQVSLPFAIKGGGNPEDLRGSLGTIQNAAKAARKNAVQQVNNQEFPERAVLHFDGVTTSLDKLHGNRRKEHLCVTVTGLGGERKLGVFEIENGTGMTKNF